MKPPERDKQACALTCRFGWHRWAKWGAVTKCRMVNRGRGISCTPLGMSFTSTEPIEYTEYRQERTCSDCGKLERREVLAQ